jgi:ABC-type nitrate/sulfonate/bicarbonate transport system permease component
VTRRGHWRLPFDARALVVPVGFLVLAEIAARVVNYQSSSLPWPSAVATAGIAAFLDGSMLRATGQTLLSAAGGLAIGASLGLVLGALMGIFLIFHRLMEVTIECLRPIPSVALIPIVLLIFGLGYAMEITLIAKTSFWPMLLLTIAAVRGVKPRLLEVAKLLRMGLIARIAKVVIPAALPGIFVGFRLAVGAALVVAVTVEIAANPLGLGYAMMRAQEALRPELVFAYLIWIGLVGWLINASLVALQRRLFSGAPRPGEEQTS